MSDMKRELSVLVPIISVCRHRVGIIAAHSVVSPLHSGIVSRPPRIACLSLVESLTQSYPPHLLLIHSHWASDPPALEIAARGELGSSDACKLPLTRVHSSASQRTQHSRNLSPHRWAASIIPMFTPFSRERTGAAGCPKRLAWSMPHSHILRRRRARQGDKGGTASQSVAA